MIIGKGIDLTVEKKEYAAVLDLSLTSRTGLTVPLYLTQSSPNAIVVDWGDGSPKESNAELSTSFSHTYSSTGDYVIKLDCDEDATWTAGDTTHGLLGQVSGSSGGILTALKHAIVHRCSELQAKAFYKCSSLVDAVIAKGTILIGESAFFGCSSLTSIELSRGLVSVGRSAFSDALKLSSIVIPHGVVSVGSSAFSYCSSLATVQIPDSIRSIGSSAFYLCTSLNYNIYDNAKYLGNESNPYIVLIKPSATNIVSCSIHPRTIVISDEAFNRCTSLVSLTISNDVISIGSQAFRGCTSLIEVNIPDSVVLIGSSIFYQCTSLTTVKLSNNLISLESSTFSGCTSLTSITIPDSVTSIGGFAFRDCTSLTSVTIGNSVTSIGYHAFYGCTSLVLFTCKAVSPPTILRETFQGAPSNLNIYVPAQSVERYKAARYWSNRADYIQAIPE